MTDAPPEPIPSATVVFLRDGSDGIETLLLQRAPHKGKPGPWVFPGGRVEASDVVDGDAHSVDTARVAAVRETVEECALLIAGEDLHLISRWVTPEVSPRRFDAWFFVAAPDQSQSVRVDGDEMVDHRWIAPRAALDADEVDLAPPQFVTLSWLLEFERAADALRELPARELVTFRPKICRTESGVVMLYGGDAGYDSADPDASGARHRCVADAGQPYRYQRTT